MAIRFAPTWFKTAARADTQQNTIIKLSKAGQQSNDRQAASLDKLEPQ
jgi:hypothetical protein